MLSNNTFSETFHRFFPKKSVDSVSPPKDLSSEKDPFFHLLEDLFSESHFEINRTFTPHTFGPGRFKTWTGTTEQTGSFQQALQNTPKEIDTSTPLYEETFCSLFPQIGFSLSKPVKTIELEGHTVYSSDKGALLISFDRELSEELLNAMIEEAPDMILCLDR